MQPTASLLTSPIAEFLQDKPQALSELGRGFLSIITDNETLKEITDLHCQQAGDLVIRVIRGKGFPVVDLHDSSIPQSATIAKITRGWLSAVLLHSAVVHERNVPPFFAAVVQNEGARGRIINTEVPAIEVIEAAGVHRIVPNTSNGVAEALASRLELVNDLISQLDPQRYQASQEWHWKYKQLLIFSQMRGFADRYQLPLSEIGPVLEAAGNTGKTSRDTERCFHRVRQLYFEMMQDLPKTFTSKEKSLEAKHR